jgi:ribosomal protein L37AE/L43A
METKKELAEYISSMHLQNNNFRDSDDAFRYGIECAIDELIELKKLRVADVIKSEASVCPKCKSENMSDATGNIGTCFDCYHVWQTVL